MPNFSTMFNLNVKKKLLMVLTLFEKIVWKRLKVVGTCFLNPTTISAGRFSGVQPNYI